MVLPLKTGIVQKKSEGAFVSWEERFLVLANCGLLYFKKGEDQPKKFKSLNNFIVKALTPEEERKVSKKNVLRVSFNKIHVKKDMLIACATKGDRDGWIRSLTEYQLLVFEARMKKFAEKLTSKK